MATVYKLELTSHWINYSEETLKKLIEEKLGSVEHNEITVDKIIRK